MINKKKAFTLLELMVVITIVGLLMTLSYAPYNYFKKKAELKIAVKNISKTLTQSRNKAIFGISSGSTNQSVGVYFEKDKNYIKIFNYPYDFGTGANIILDNKYLKEKINIGKFPQIRKIEGKEKVLFLFSAISGKLNIFEFDGVLKQDLIDIGNDNIIKIGVGYKGVDSGGLYKELKYYTKTFIIDF